jgi:bifunctional DNase/RNase
VMGPVARYVSALRTALLARASPRVVAEVEHHLTDAARAYLSRGMGLTEAEERAVADFGSVELIASEFIRLYASSDAEVILFVRREAALSALVEVEVSDVRVGPLTEDEARRWGAEWLKNDSVLHGVVLKERGGERELCFFCGDWEATSIAMGREGTATQRPMTHDFFGLLVESLDDLSVERVVITRLEDKTFYAEMQVVHHDESSVLDCRPSDGIAVAVRLGVPIYVSSSVPPFSQAA